MGQSSTSNVALPDASSVQQLLAAGQARGNIIERPGYQPMLLVPEACKLVAVPHAERAPLPDHVRQAVSFVDAPSFIDYVKQWKRAETVIFACLPGANGQAEFRAIFDYHTRESQGTGHAAARCAHVAVYACPLSEEWETWMGANGTAQAQRDFIDFIEANAPDIVSPSAASLMELAMNFEARTEVNFSSKMDRTTGGRNLNFTENVEAGGRGGAGQIKVPDAMKLRLPVFEGGAAFDVDVRLEWVPRDGRLKVIVHLQRPAQKVREALASIRADIEAPETGTGIRVLNGAASAPDNKVS
jgi:uncharacterized protein YfdQ (DUF2303 family)